MKLPVSRYLAAVLALVSLVLPSRASVPCPLEFAPQEGQVAAAERPYRDELCLNGRWQFQPVAIPASWVRDQGSPPDLPMPSPNGWDATPIRIPSPWNVNIWGGGRVTGEGTQHPFWPNSETFPSYPKSWDGAQMGWLRRSFQVPAKWTGKHVLLHFEAVAGECRVLVNGKEAGGHFDNYTPFDLDITPLLQAGDNELLVGVRHHHLFSKTDSRFPKFHNPFPNGSNTEPLVGIWQDVSLVAVDPVHVTDTFVKPLVSQDRLEVEVTLSNDSSVPQALRIGGTVAPWINLAGKSVAEAPVPKGKLGDAALLFPAVPVTLPANGRITLTLTEPVKNHLKLWSPDSPNLYGFVATVARGTTILDRHYTRFGWREVKIQGRDLLLNGKKIQLFGDLVHPFGTFVMSRRYAWAWYRMVKDMNGNAVRIHAQPMPRFYLDLADEMGLMVLDETAIFGSSINLNFAEPVAWARFDDEYDSLVRRDRSHPCVFGWSFGNELFAIFSYNKVPKDLADEWYGRLAALGMRERKLDSTREWISCDGDEDLRGTMPVWAKHFGMGLPLDRIPDIDKPLMVGESGGTYYAKPPRYADYNGDRAYQSYAGRNEALAIDAYENVVKMARPKLAFFSASETVWFGLEPLPLGYNDFSRLPTKDDGVVFTRSYEEGKFGWQPERISAYVTTLNPGWDSSLPVYKPLAMFDAMKAALAPGGPAPSPWDHHEVPVSRPTPPPATIETVAFAGPADGTLARNLDRCGIALAAPNDETSGLLIVDGASLPGSDKAAVRERVHRFLQHGATVLLLATGGGSASDFSDLLPEPVTLTDRQATLLLPKDTSPWTASIGEPDLYFAENSVDKQILKHGLSGPFVEKGKTLLVASEIDWSQFDTGEAVKVGALMLSEQLHKPSGAALVLQDWDGGHIAVCTIETEPVSPAHAALWRKLLSGMGVRLGAIHLDSGAGKGAAGEHDLLRDGPPVVTPKK